jgi:hypothetical protein
MINLIPDNIRENNRYAYRNVGLLRYTMISVFTIAAIGAITALSIFGMLQTSKDMQTQIDEQNQKLTTYKTLEKQGEALSTQLNTIGSLLNRQVNFSVLLPQIAKIMPEGAILKELNFSTSDILATTSTGTKNTPSNSGGTASTPPVAAAVQKPFVILAGIKDRNVATTLLENIRVNDKLFTDADLIELNQVSAADGDATVFSRYKYEVTINAYLKKQTNTSGIAK